ncbi:hypothetical protein, partial [Rossellomorea marisflavi]|uniref:hypothetical protein n=1 Tax=Rossellomorea marisflavi TaxID=189381 RepID=UPI0035149EFE
GFWECTFGLGVGLNAEGVAWVLALGVRGFGLVQPGQREREKIAALSGGEGVDLVDHDAFEPGEHLCAVGAFSFVDSAYAGSKQDRSWLVFHLLGLLSSWRAAASWPLEG